MQINAVANAAIKLERKPSKQEAFDGLITLTEEYVADKGAIEALAQLYAFFLPKIIAPKTPFQWVAKARGKKDVRYYLNHVYSDGERTIATDGHRLHVIPVARDPGWYDDAGVRVEVDAKYPDIDRVIPGPKATYSTPNFDELEIHDASVQPLSYAVSETFGVQVSYLKEALMLSEYYTIKIYPEEQKVVVDHGKALGFAVIMGYHLKDEKE